MIENEQTQVLDVQPPHRTTWILGFRTGTPWKKGVAIVGYFIFGMTLLSWWQVYEAWDDRLYNLLGFLVMVVPTFAYATNLCGVRDRLCPVGTGRIVTLLGWGLLIIFISIMVGAGIMSIDNANRQVRRDAVLKAREKVEQQARVESLEAEKAQLEQERFVAEKEAQIAREAARVAAAKNTAQQQRNIVEQQEAKRREAEQRKAEALEAKRRAERERVAAQRRAEAERQRQYQRYADRVANARWSRDLYTPQNGNFMTASDVFNAMRDGGITITPQRIPPATVRQAPWKYYGNLITVQGQCSVLQCFPAGDNVSAQLGG